MEENSVNQHAPVKKNYVFPVVILALILIVAVGYFVTQQDNDASTTTQPVVQEITTEGTEPTTESSEVVYADGTYEAVGNYVSPGGPREIDVTITLEDGVVVATTFVGNATDAPSQRFQGEFGDNYEAQVVGKNIDEIALTKVSGSSLTPKGFNDALEQIKSEAKQTQS